MFQKRRNLPQDRAVDVVCINYFFSKVINIKMSKHHNWDE